MKRLWGIRHVRFFWALVQLPRWAPIWDQVGIAWGPQHEAALRTLDRIWNGEA